MSFHRFNQRVFQQNWPGADVDPGVKSARGFDIQFFSANSTTDPCEPVNGVIDLAEDDGATSP